MTRELPWATRIAAHLSLSRDAGRTFEQAWAAAIVAHPPVTRGDERWEPHTLKFAQGKFRLGYMRAHVLGTTLSGARLFADSYDAEAHATETRCAWGGGCHEPRKEGRHLCPEHFARVRSIFALCLHPDCHSHKASAGAANFCAPGEDFCPSHGGPPVPKPRAMARMELAAGISECVTPGCTETARGLRCDTHAPEEMAA